MKRDPASYRNERPSPPIEVIQRVRNDIGESVGCEPVAVYAKDLLVLLRLIHEREAGGVCLNAISSNEPCKPDDTLKRCTLCGFIVDTKYKAEFP